MALRFSENDENSDLNPGHKDYENKFNALDKAEQKGTAQESAGKTPLDSIKNAEESPGKGWKNNFTGAMANAATGGKFAFVKKNGAGITIIVTLVGTVIGLLGMAGSALLPETILANLVQKFNLQETSFTLRANKMLASKMASASTEGPCDIIKIACRFSRPSNRFLDQLAENGIEAIDKSGNTITKNGLWLNTRPKYYNFTDSAGDQITVQAKDLEATLEGNAEFRDAFHKASKTRFESLSDSVFGFIKEKFGFSSTDKLASTADDAANGGSSTNVNADEAVTQTLDDSVQVDDAGAGEALAQGGAAVDDAATQMIETEANAEATQIEQAGSGDTITLAAAGICGVADIPGVITKAVRGFQMMQLIKYSAVFLSAFGAIKAGDAKPAEVSAIGDILTKNVNGKSAMDSFGMRYVMTGDSNPINGDYKKFSPGASIVAKLGKMEKIADNKYKQDACKVMSNPVTGKAIQGAMAINAWDTAGVSLAGVAVDMITAFLLQKFMEATLPTLISAAVKLIPMDKILEFFVGNLTKDIKGEDVGNALVSGASHTMGQTSNAGGNMPLSVNEAIAYEATTKQVQLAYAEEDRATKSPFDISSPNTMLGSIVYKLTPYLAASSFGSFSSVLGSISKIVGTSFGLALQPLSAHAADGSEYKMCDDPSIADNDIAAGPFCNVIYGVPPKYLNSDPVQVADDLIKSGDVDPDTGDPIPDKGLDKWIKMCTSGRTDQAQFCKINEDTQAKYAIYTIDHRVQKSMDDDTSSGLTSDGSGGSGSNGNGSIPVTPVSNPVNGAATICVDAGHPPNGAPGEPEYALKTAQALQTELQNRGYKVIMTRTDSNPVSIPDRPKKCIDGKANLMYSIHGENDGAVSSHPYTIYMKDSRNQSATSKKYADIIQKAIVSSVNGSHGMQGKQGICMEGSCTALSNLGIFRGADGGGLPAVLSEVVRSNDDGSSAIDDPTYLKKLVTGIANGIEQIFPIPSQKITHNLVAV